jgi:predicted amidohydrolase
MSLAKVRVATAQYPLRPFLQIKDWQDHLTLWVRKAAEEGARLLLFPEYGSTDLGVIEGNNPIPRANDLIQALQRHKEFYLEIYAQLASEHKVYILAGGMPVVEKDGAYNRSYFFSPKGKMGYQDKLMMTRFERERTFLTSGKKTTIFETEFGKIAIAICFDIQFPKLVRRLAERGCDLLLVPSCTGALAGYNRVKIGCQARALESQMAVVSSVTVGDAKWQPIADTNCGASGFFAPPDYGFPDDGVIALGDVNQPLWVYAELDLKKFHDIRTNGHVKNWECWPEQDSKLQEPLLDEVLI